MTDEGFLRATGLSASAAVYEYAASELGLDAALGMDPERIVRLYKSPTELAKSAPSYVGQTITNGHPDQKVTAETWADVAEGHVEKTWADAAGMHIQALICSREAIDDVQAGRAELSHGYDCDIDLTPGTLPDGTAYDGQQINIQGNHIALVDVARGGPRCRLADRKPTPATGGTMRTFVINGIKVQAEDTAADVIEREAKALTDKAEGAEKRATAADTALAAATKAKEDGDKAHAAEVEALKKQIPTPEQYAKDLASLAKVIDQAKKLAPELDIDGKTAAQIRVAALGAIVAADESVKALVTAIAGDTAALDKADPKIVESAFGAVLAVHKPAPDYDEETVRRMTGDGHDDDERVTATDGETGLVGQELYRYRLTHPQTAGK